MTASTNLTLQVTAVVAFAVMRSATPMGWLAGFFLIFLGPIVVLVPSVLAGYTRRRYDRLPHRLTVAYLLAATSLVTGGALIPDMSDMRSYPAPLAVLIPGLDHGLGMAGLLAVPVFLLALVAVLDLQRIGRREPA